MDDPVWWALAIGLLHQQAVRSQLENMGIIWRIRRAPGLDFDRDDLSILLDEIIGLACQIPGWRGKEAFPACPSRAYRCK